MSRFALRIPLIIMLLGFSAVVLSQSVFANLILPPMGYLGTNPWSFGYSTPPLLIDVYIDQGYGDPWPSNWINQWKTVPLDGSFSTAYVPSVILGELGGSSIKPGWAYNGWLWHDEAIKALSIAARSFGSFRAERRSTPYGSGIYNSEIDQVYRPFRTDVPITTKQRYQDLAAMYSGLYLAYSSPPTQRYKVNLIEALYTRDLGSPSTPSLWGSNPANSYPYLPSVANPHSTGELHGIGGMPQMPLQGWTATGGGNATFWQLLSHYYPNTTLMNKQPEWDVNYYYSRNESGCTGNAFQTTKTKWINYDWSTGSLGIINDGRDQNSSVPQDNVCMEFSTFADFTGSWYTFYIVADDGFKLLIDGNEILSKWEDQAPTMYAVNVPLAAGEHSITLRYYEKTGGAVARMSWRQWNGMVGKYYDNVMPKGDNPPSSQIIVERFDPAIGFAWGESSPLDTQETSDSPYPKIHPDSFAAIWTSTIRIPPQNGCRTVNFTVVTDDGMLVMINNQVHLDKWYDQPPTTYTFTACLYPGAHEIKVYYYESGGGATARVTWY